MTTQELLDERYGRTRSRRSRRWWTLGAGAAIAAGVGVIAWYAFASAADAVDTTTTAFHLIDDHTVTVTFQITGPADKAIACVLEADDADHGVVGWKVVQYPASGTHAQAFTEQIPVTGIATTGFVNTCWVP